MSDVVLIRPGCTDFDDQNRILGDLDLPMNVRGLGQVDDLIDELRDTNFKVIYCDPTEPARSTAGSIGEKLGVRVKERDELRNVDHGLWQGLQVEDIKRKFPKAYKKWRDAPETICPPEGEPILEVLERVRKVLKKPLKKELPIAIVASEPLATLIECMIAGRKPALPQNAGINTAASHIRILKINEHCDDNNDDRPTKPPNGSAAKPNTKATP